MLACSGPEDVVARVSCPFNVVIGLEFFYCLLKTDLHSATYFSYYSDYC